MKLFMNIKEIEGLLCCYYSKRSTIQPVLIIFQPSNLKQILKKNIFLCFIGKMFQVFSMINGIHQ